MHSQHNSHQTTFGNNGGVNIQDNHSSSTHASGGGPSFKINGKDASMGDAVGMLGKVFGALTQKKNL